MKYLTFFTSKLEHTLLSVFMCVNCVAVLFFTDLYIALFAKLFSKDNYISRVYFTLFKVQLVLIFAVLLVFLRKPLKKSCLTFKWSFLGILGVTVAYVIIKKIYGHGEIYYENFLLYREDGLFQTGTSIIAILAGGFLLTTLKYRVTTFSKIILLFLVSVFLFFGFEEISWGQRIFNWSTSEAWSKINAQNETNIHNLFNDLFHTIYPIVIGFYSGLMFLIYYIKNKYKFNNEFSRLLPGEETLLFAFSGLFFLLFYLIYFEGEIIEQVFSIMFLTYALRQYRLFKGKLSETC